MTSIEIKIAEATAFINAGNELRAMEVLSELLKEDPYNQIAIDSLFVFYYKRYEFEKAIDILNPIIEHRPDSFHLSNRALAYIELTKIKEAEADCNQAIKLNSNNPHAWINLGSVFRISRKFTESLLAYDKGLEQDPTNLKALAGKGLVYTERQDWKKAADEFEAALKINPNDSEVLFTYSFNLLAAGDYNRGFKYYERRFDCGEAKKYYRTFKKPLWHKYLDLKGKTILIHVEQGFGDSIIMSRFFKTLSNMGARVIAETRGNGLFELFKTIEGVDEVIQFNEHSDHSDKDFDYQLPIMSLPLQLGITVDTVPYSNGYIKADIKKTEVWNHRLGEKTKTRIGIVWTGSLSQQINKYRSFSFSEFAKCLPEGPEYICLQQELPENDRESFFQRQDIRFFGDLLHDFSETAALIENLDLVITVDTSVAHLSGAMAKPTWVVIPHSPDWRWGLQGPTPWYSSVKVIRRSVAWTWSHMVHQIATDILDYK
jgi:tetratricopeptide (TPR) repeat protein